MSYVFPVPCVAAVPIGPLRRAADCTLSADSTIVLHVDDAPRQVSGCGSFLR